MAFTSIFILVIAAISSSLLELTTALPDKWFPDRKGECTYEFQPAGVKYGSRFYLCRPCDSPNGWCLEQKPCNETPPEEIPEGYCGQGGGGTTTTTTTTEAPTPEPPTPEPPTPEPPTPEPPTPEPPTPEPPTPEPPTPEPPTPEPPTPAPPTPEPEPLPDGCQIAPLGMCLVNYEEVPNDDDCTRYWRCEICFCSYCHTGWCLCEHECNENSDPDKTGCCYR